MRSLAPRLLLALLAGACAPAAPRTPRGVPAPTPPIEAGAPAAAPWVPRRDGAPQRHDLRIASELQSHAIGDSTVRTDSVHALAEVTWSEPSTGWPRRRLGTLLDFRTGARADSLEVPPAFPLPVHFSAVQESRAVGASFAEPDLAGCGAAHSSALLAVRDLWISLPDTLQPGLAWRDSTSLRVCLDSIPLATTVTREFVVVGSTRTEAGRLVEVERRSGTSIAGRGAQFGDSVEVEGTGSGVLRYIVALEGERVVSADGESTLTLRLRGSRRTTETTQRSRITIRER